MWRRGVGCRGCCVSLYICSGIYGRRPPFRRLGLRGATSAAFAPPTRRPPGGCAHGRFAVRLRGRAGPRLRPRAASGPPRDLQFVPGTLAEPAGADFDVFVDPFELTVPDFIY